MGIVIAGADFGSNKVGYIVAEMKGGELETIERESRFTRLAGEAMARTLLYCNEMHKRFRKLGVEKFRGVGTEALRRASNTPDFLELIEPILGWPVEVISGEEEGRITFRRARSRSSTSAADRPRSWSAAIRPSAGASRSRSSAHGSAPSS